jgi:peptide/nickel transport system permease protein
MGLFLLRRALLSVPTLLLVSVAVFSMLHTAPGDPAELLLGPFASQEQIARVSAELGLDRPIAVQFVKWFGNVLQGDLGRSYTLRLPVLQEVTRKYGATLLLAVAAVIISSAVGVSAGVVAAVKRGTPTDGFVMVLALVGLSVPVFWLGMILIVLFAVRTPLFPVGGMVTPGDGGLTDHLRHLALPAATLGAANAGYLARFVRSSLIEVLGEDYVRTAVAKGIPRRAVVLKHALRNVMVKVVTVQGVQFGYLLGGAVLTETVFSWPGIGTLMLQAILSRDFPLVQGAVLVVSVSFIVVNALVDLAYGMIDPRVRYG